MPLYHSASGMLGLGQALLSGTTVVIRKKFSASNFWSDCIKYNVTVAQYIGEICRYLLAQPEKPEDKGHKVRAMIGNGLRVDIWQQFVDRFKIKNICELYGSTEGNANLINFDGKVGAVGFLPRLVDFLSPMKLVKVNREGEPIRDPKTGLLICCKPNEPGEFVSVIYKGHPARDFEGYADASSVRKKIVHDVFRKGDSAFRSGDVLVRDELGYFYFKDRQGDTFRWKGENVSTTEVEGVISKICNLTDAAVYGVQIPGADGRVGMAAIADPDGILDLDMLATQIIKQLPSYARPLFIRIKTHIDMTGTHKMKKTDLQEEAYDLSKVKDPLYYLCGGKYIPFDQDAAQKLERGEIRH
jgi:solute carrier family 27 fatty acid transporter 1/4